MYLRPQRTSPTSLGRRRRSGRRQKTPAHRSAGDDLATGALPGADPAAELVRRGLAVSTGGYDAEEQAARHEKTGIWSGPFDRPADWLHREGMMAEAPSWLDAIAFRLGLRQEAP